MLLAQIVQHGTAFLLQFLHQFFVIIRRNALLEQVTHHVLDKTLLLIRCVLANIAQQPLLIFHSGKQALEFLRVPTRNAELLMVHGQRQGAIHKQACNQPLHIYRQETIRLLSERVQERFQRGNCSGHGVTFNPVTDIAQSTTIASAFAVHAHLVCVCEQFTDILLGNSFINIRQMVKQAFHLLLEGIVQAGFKITGTTRQLGAVHINVRLRKRLLQEHLDILAAFFHFILFCFTDCTVFCNTASGAAAQIVLNLQHGAQFVVQARIIMQLHKNGMVTTVTGRNHLQASFVTAIIAAGRDNFNRNRVIRTGKGVILINLAIEAERIAIAQIRIAVLICTIVFIKDQRSQFTVHLRVLRVAVGNFPVDLLFLIGKESIVISQILHQLCLHQFFQCNFDTFFYLVPILIQPGYHKGRNILYRGRFELLHILDHEQNLEHLNFKTCFILIWI